jgi:hypothetical protein
MYDDLIDLETLMALRKAAPQVTAVPFDTARALVQGLYELSQAQTAHVDADGRKYWAATLKEIRQAARLDEETSMALVGKGCRGMGLVLWRENDGYHAAFSEAQVRILRERFKA